MCMTEENAFHFEAIARIRLYTDLHLVTLLKCTLLPCEISIIFKIHVLHKDIRGANTSSLTYKVVVR